MIKLTFSIPQNQVPKINYIRGATKHQNPIFFIFFAELGGQSLNPKAQTPNTILGEKVITW